MALLAYLLFILLYKDYAAVICFHLKIIIYHKNYGFATFFENVGKMLNVEIWITLLSTYPVDLHKKRLFFYNQSSVHCHHIDVSFLCLSPRVSNVDCFNTLNVCANITATDFTQSTHFAFYAFSLKRRSSSGADVVTSPERRKIKQENHHQQSMGFAFVLKVNAINVWANSNSVYTHVSLTWTDFSTSFGTLTHGFLSIHIFKSKHDNPHWPDILM